MFSIGTISLQRLYKTSIREEMKLVNNIMKENVNQNVKNINTAYSFET